MLRFLLIAIFLFEGKAFALVMLRVQTGGALTQMTKESGALLSGQGYSAGGSVTWHPGTGQKMSPFFIGLSARQMKSTYFENSIEKRATYNTFGATLGFYSSLSENWGFEGGLSYLPIAQLTTLSTNQLQLNGSTFRYSTWQQYSGQGAGEVRLLLLHEKTSGQFSKRNRFRTGFGLTYLQQSFQSVDTDVSNSKELLSPAQTSSLEEEATLFKVLGLEFSFGITF